MGRAIVRDPAAFLFDEPLSNLDAKLRVQMRSEIKTLHQRVKTPSIYVTHDQIEAMTLADRVVILNGGNIEQAGRPIELYDKPDNLFVAAFIGTPSMNLIEATIVKADNGLAAAFANGQSIPVPNGHPTMVEHEQVIVGMRPEHFVPHAGGAQLTGAISLVEPTGAQTHVTFDIAGTPATAVLDGGVDLSVGQPLSVSIDPAKVHFFDKKTERRI
jgi:multiple sugar transport system ATP-binding protein